LVNAHVGLLADGPQQALAALGVGRVRRQYRQDIVEPAGAHECFVEPVRPIGRRQDNYLSPAGIRRKPLHDRAQHTDANAGIAAGLATLGEGQIDFIGEYDAGRHGFDGFEEALDVTLRVADDPAEQLGEIDEDEVDTAVGRQQLGVPRLPGARTARQNETTGAAAPVADQHRLDYEVLAELFEQLKATQQTPYRGPLDFFTLALGFRAENGRIGLADVEDGPV